MRASSIRLGMSSTSSAPILLPLSCPSRLRERHEQAQFLADRRSAREGAARRGVPRNGTTHDPGAGISRTPLMDDFAAADQLFWGNASQAPPGGTIRASNRREVYRGPVAPIGPHADSVPTRGLAGIASQTRGRRRSYTS